jgi:hypothetical protein
MSLLLNIRTTITGTADFNESTDVFSASGGVTVAGGETSLGGGASGKRQAKREYRAPYIKIDPYFRKPSELTITGTAGLFENTDSMSAKGRHAPPEIDGMANLFAKSPIIMAKGSMNTDKIDSELAIALLYL